MCVWECVVCPFFYIIIIIMIVAVFYVVLVSMCIKLVCECGERTQKSDKQRRQQQFCYDFMSELSQKENVKRTKVHIVDTGGQKRENNAEE